MKHLTSILLVVWTVIVAWLLLTPSDPNRFYHFFEGEDKVAHVILFMVWSFLLTVRGLYAAMNIRNVIVLAVIISLSTAIGTELLQEIIPNRSRDFMDFVADAVGGFVGIFMAIVFNKVFVKA